MIKKIRLLLSDLLLSLAFKALPKNSGEQLLLAMTIKKYRKLQQEAKKSFSNES